MSEIIAKVMKRRKDYERQDPQIRHQPESERDSAKLEAFLALTEEKKNEVIAFFTKNMQTRFVIVKDPQSYIDAFENLAGKTNALFDCVDNTDSQQEIDSFEFWTCTKCNEERRISEMHPLAHVMRKHFM